jgi:hypothetical protein
MPRSEGTSFEAACPARRAPASEQHAQASAHGMRRMAVKDRQAWVLFLALPGRAGVGLVTGFAWHRVGSVAWHRVGSVATVLYGWVGLRELCKREGQN